MKINQDEETYRGGKRKKGHFLYRNYGRCRINGGLFEIKYNDDPSLNWDGFKLTFHLSHFPSFLAFLESFKILTQNNFNILFQEGRITRFDFATDCLRDFNSLSKGVHKAGVRTLQVWENKNGLRSIYIGSIKNSHIRIYEKLNVTRFDCEHDLRTDHLKRNRISCRIEQVLTGKKLPFRTLSGLIEKIWEFEFFQGLSFTNQGSTYEWISDDKTRQRVQSFCFLQSQIGYIEARKKFSQSRNFERDVGQYLKASPALNIQELVQKRLERIFEIETVNPQQGYENECQ